MLRAHVQSFGVRIVGILLACALLLLLAALHTTPPASAQAEVAKCDPQCNSWYDNQAMHSEGDTAGLMVGTEISLTLPTTNTFAHSAWQGPSYSLLWIPVDDYTRTAIVIHNRFNVSVSVQLRGAFLKTTGATPRTTGALLTTKTVIAGGEAIFSAVEGDTWGVSEGVPMMDAGWTHMILAITPASAPSSGYLMIQNSRTK